MPSIVRAQLLTDRRLAAGVVFALDPDLFFYANEELDFAIVGVAAGAADGQRLTELGHLPLIPVNGKILVGHAISIIQHPDGGPKKYGVRDNELLIAPAETDLFLEYTTDTLPGSSGAPAFNKDWEVVALHHSGVPEIRDGQIARATALSFAASMSFALAWASGSMSSGWTYADDWTVIGLPVRSRPFFSEIDWPSPFLRW
ncbi:MAG: trypsin-like serine peptidase [Longimicrobiales bacterium]